jgi:hypothetical protein
MLAPSPRSLAQGGEGGKAWVCVYMVQKECRRESNFFFSAETERRNRNANEY